LHSFFSPRRRGKKKGSKEIHWDAVMSMKGGKENRREKNNGGEEPLSLFSFGWGPGRKRNGKKKRRGTCSPLPSPRRKKKKNPKRKRKKGTSLSPFFLTCGRYMRGRRNFRKKGTNDALIRVERGGLKGKGRAGATSLLFYVEKINERQRRLPAGLRGGGELKGRNGRGLRLI